MKVVRKPRVKFRRLRRSSGDTLAVWRSHQAFQLFAFVSVAAVVVAAGLSAYSKVEQTMPDRSLALKWTRTGGIAGLQETLVVATNGSWVIEEMIPAGSISKRVSGTLNASRLNELIDFFSGSDLAALNGTSFAPRSGAADYFRYRIEVVLGGRLILVEWVDPWACAEQLPKVVADTQKFLSELVRELLSAP